MADGKTIVIGVCGGIAAYKTVEVVSRLRQQGHDVHVAMSEAACAFITPMTFAGVSGNRVLTKTFPDPEKNSGDDLYPHLYPATRADIFVLMPATADMMSRIAHGTGQEIVSLCALSLPPTCRRFFCPSMNVEMWDQDSVQDSVRTLESRGWTRIGPNAGALACGMEGAGRMSEPSEILSHVTEALRIGQSMKEMRVLITSGPTHEHLDPVRFIANGSSGRMGQALAEEAADRGAKVTFVTGPVHPSLLPRRDTIKIVPVTSAEEMLAACVKPFKKCHAAIFAAAVADYKPSTMANSKRAKTARGWSLRLTPTPDIAATCAASKKSKQRLIGFALQTGDGLAEAATKRATKNLDGIVLNHPEAMKANDGVYTFITADNPPEMWGALSKRACAQKILDALLEL